MNFPQHRKTVIIENHGVLGNSSVAARGILDIQNRHLKATVIEVTCKLVPEPLQQEAIHEMRRLRTQGVSYRSIEAKMAEQGFKVSHQSVKAILAYERNK